MSLREETLESRLSQNNGQSVQTTVGELIEALTQVAMEAGNSEAEGYRLASLALADLMKQRQALARRNETATPRKAKKVKA